MDVDRDQILMQRLAGGDEEAMAELLQHWQRPVLAFVRRFLGCAEDEAQELAQEAFLRVWRQRSRWKPKAAVSTWLFTIVANLCRNRKRDLARQPMLVRVDAEHGGELELDLRTAPGQDPHALAEAGQLARSLHTAVCQLPEKQRAALLMKRFKDMSYREIGEVLGVSPAAVDSLLVRARRSLAAHLAQDSRPLGVERNCEDVDAL